MLARPVLALVCEPIIRRGVDALTPVRGEQLVYVCDPHRASDDLAHAGHEQVAALREDDGVVFALCVLLRRRGCLFHVKRLELGGEAVQEDGRADDVCHLTFRSLGNVVADGVRDHRGFAVRVLDDIAFCVLGLMFDPVFVQPRDGVDVREAHERTGRLREGWVELLDQRRAGFVL